MSRTGSVRRWARRRQKAARKRLSTRWLGARRRVLAAVRAAVRTEELSALDPFAEIVSTAAPASIEPRWGYVVQRRVVVVEESLPTMVHHLDDPRLRIPGVGLPRVTDLVRPCPSESFERPLVSIRHPWEGNYYHATIECLGALAACDEMGLLDGSAIVVGTRLASSRLWREFAASRSDLLSNVVVQDGQWLDTTADVVFHRGQLVPATVIADGSVIYSPAVSRRWLERLTRFVAPDAVRHPPPDRAERRLYLRRGSGHSGRTLVNEDDVVDAVVARGFEVLDPSRLGWVEQVSALRSASYVLSVHGAALTNTIYRAPYPLSVFEIQSGRYYGLHYEKISQALGYRHETFVARGGIGNPKDETFEVDLTEFVPAVDAWLAPT